METILVVNAGSSSVKFQVFGLGEANQPEVLIKGQMDGIGARPRLRARSANDAVLIDQTYTTEAVPDVATAIRTAGSWLKDTQNLNPIGVGHRVVHGGPKFDRPVLVDDEVIKQLERYIPLAPLHQPNNLAPIRSIRARLPELPQVACFDTAFHRGHDAVADHFAIPESFYVEGVRRYGFHGLSYEFVAEHLRKVAPEIADGRVIVAHLGSGASMCALHKGRSVESTMGFTALDGLPMGTRPGQIDPGFLLYLMTEKAMSADAVQRFLYGDCGLKGLSGVSNDMRELLESPEPGAALAVEHFVYRASLFVGLLAAALGGLDAFVFTAGIGERSVAIRQRIVERMAWLGAELDPVANAAGKTSIARASSRLAIYVVPTDEELMIAKHTLALLTAGRSQAPTFKRSA